MAVPAYSFATSTFEAIGGTGSTPATMHGLYVWAKNAGGAASEAINAPLGENIISNGDFTSWTTDDPDGWTIVGEGGSYEVSEVGTGEGHGGVGTGACNLYSGVFEVSIGQAVLSLDDYYEVTVMCDTVTSGGFRVEIGMTNSNLEASPTSGTTYTYRGQCAGSTVLKIRNYGASDITFGDVVVKKIIPMFSVFAKLDVGDGSTATWFTSTNESVYFVDGEPFNVLANATLDLKFSDWSFSPATSTTVTASGSALLMEESKLTIRDHDGYKDLNFYGDDVFTRSIICGEYGQVNHSVRWWCADVVFTDVKIEWLGDPFAIYVSPTINSLYLNNVSFGVVGNSSADITATNVEFGDSLIYEVRVLSAYAITLSNPIDIPVGFNPNIAYADGSIPEKYTTNIHITDGSGDDLESVTVACTYANVVTGSDTNKYKCIADHVAVDVTHKPITGTDWATYWELYEGNIDAGDWNAGFAYWSDNDEWFPELCVNGDFSDTTSTDSSIAPFAGWTNLGTHTDGDETIKFTISNGDCRVQSTNGTYTSIQVQNSFVLGEDYNVTLEITDVSAGGIQIKNGGTTYTYTSPQSVSLNFTASSTALEIKRHYSGDSITDATFSNVSIKKVGTNPATDANGVITEQQIQYRKWAGTSKYQETRLHSFTLSHASYEDWAIPERVIDGVVDWDLKYPDCPVVSSVLDTDTTDEVAGTYSISGSVPSTPSFTLTTGTNAVTLNIDGDDGVTNEVRYKTTTDSDWVDGGSRSGDGDVTVSSLIDDVPYQFSVYSTLAGAVSEYAPVQAVTFTSDADNDWDTAAADMVGPWFDAFKESGTYLPTAGGSRDIDVGIEYTGDQGVGLHGGGPVAHVTAHNDATTGIAQAEIVKGRDNITITMRDGSTGTRLINDIVSADSAWVVLEVI